MLNCKDHSIEIRKNYSIEDFHDKIKEIMKACSVDQTPLTFLFTDSQIVYESKIDYQLNLNSFYRFLRGYQQYVELR